MSSSEKYWALKSSNLKRITESGKRRPINGTRSRNSLTNRSDGVARNYASSDIRKSSYPVLPNLPHSNKVEAKSTPSTPDQFDNWENESNNQVDHEKSDFSVNKTHFNPSFNVPNVIDNTSYRGLLNNHKKDTAQNGKKESVPKNNNSRKQFVMHQNRRIIQTSVKQGIGLNVLHALQLVTFEVIDESLAEEIVPDLLINVFKEIQYKEELLRKQMVPIVRSAAEQILIEVIDQYIQETVIVTLLRDSKSHLRSQIILKWLLDEILLSIIESIVQDAIGELVQEKLKINRSNCIYEKMLSDFIKEEITKSESILFKEALLEQTLSDFVIDPVIQETLQKTGTDIVANYHQKVSRINLQQVSEMATRKPVDTLILDHLISVGIRQKQIYGSSLVGQYCFENIVFNILVKKNYEIYEKLIDTLDIPTLCQWHKNINQSIATAALLKDLVEHSDADLCDLDANEVKESYIPRYLSNVGDSIFYQSQ